MRSRLLGRASSCSYSTAAACPALVALSRTRLRHCWCCAGLVGAAHAAFAGDAGIGSTKPTFAPFQPVSPIVGSDSRAGISRRRRASVVAISNLLGQSAALRSSLSVLFGSSATYSVDGYARSWAEGPRPRACVRGRIRALMDGRRSWRLGPRAGLCCAWCIRRKMLSWLLRGLCLVRSVDRPFALGWGELGWWSKMSDLMSPDSEEAPDGCAGWS